MPEQPTYTTWRITCLSPGEAEALQQWLSSRINLDRVLADTVRATPNGVESLQTVQHRLGDYFEDIGVTPDSEPNPASFRLVFHRRQEAGRFWKDLMVNIMQEIETMPQQMAIDLDSKGDMRPSASESSKKKAKSPQLLAIVGLPGSGKSTYMKKLVGYVVLDDMGDNLTWNFDAWPENKKKLRMWLNERRNVVVTDVGFCRKEKREEFEKDFPEVTWLFFQNDPDQCRANVKKRFCNETRTHTLDKEEQSISDYSKTYDPPANAMPVGA